MKLVLTCAVAATLAIVAWHDRPWSALVMLAILGVLLARFHERRDLIGLAVGAVLGNLTELVCQRAGVWAHASGSPPYIWLCYPILGLAVPRLVDPIAPPAPASPWNALVWALHTGAAWFVGTNNGAELTVSLACLGALFALGRSRRDFVTVGVGATLGMVWEIPCTLSGAWRFPHPQLFGLIPPWLPIAYAVFFVSVGRVGECLSLHAPAAARGRPETS